MAEVRCRAPANVGFSWSDTTSSRRPPARGACPRSTFHSASRTRTGRRPAGPPPPGRAGPARAARTAAAGSGPTAPTRPSAAGSAGPAPRSAPASPASAPPPAPAPPPGSAAPAAAGWAPAHRTPRPHTAAATGSASHTTPPPARPLVGTAGQLPGPPAPLRLAQPRLQELLHQRVPEQARLPRPLHPLPLIRLVRSRHVLSLLECLPLQARRE